MPDRTPTQPEAEVTPKLTSLSARALGVVLREKREAKDMTLEEAAAKMKVSISTVQRSERGMRQVSTADLIAFGVVYGCSSLDLLKEAEDLVLGSQGK